MITQIILLIVVLALVVASSLVFIANKKISADMYLKLVKPDVVDDAGLKSSPYTIKREYSSYSSSDYYNIMKGSSRVDAERFYTLNSALKSMNELEKIGGYKQTKL
jgi:hypothetical protein